MPGAGQLRSLVQFEAPVRGADDGGGGAPINWTGVLTTRGQLITERGREALAAGRMESASGAVLRVRSSTIARTINASHRVRVDGVVYVIHAVTNPDQKNRFLEFVVERGVAGT